MSINVLGSMWVEDWIWLLEVRKWLNDFTEYELDEFKKFILWLDSNKLYDFGQRFIKLWKFGGTFYDFLEDLFNEDEIALMEIRRKVENIAWVAEVFLDRYMVILN